MQQQKSYRPTEVGTLYLIPTPIGNLEDMTYRSVRLLSEVDRIASEDTRHTQKLLNHFNIQCPQISLHEHNYKERVPELVERLQQGETIAQVSDAGMPSISDPGHELVVAAIEHDIPVVAVPGPTAGLTALIASGLSCQPYLFYGFLPRKPKEAKAVLETLKSIEATLIFYESPYRITQTLSHLATVFSEQRRVVLCRELTKVHEEYTRGTIAELLEYYDTHDVRGECCLLVEGAIESEEETPDYSSLSVVEHVDELMAQGWKNKEAIKEVARLRQMRKQDVYQAYHHH